MSAIVAANDNNKKVARTDAYLGRWGIVVGNEEGREKISSSAWNMQDLSRDLSQQQQPGDIMIEQEPLNNIWDRLRFQTLLGQGTFGRAYKCTLDGYTGTIELVAKLPSQLFNYQYIQINKDTQKLEMVDLSKVPEPLPHNNTRNLSKRMLFSYLADKAEKDFRNELDYFEQVCEPYSMYEAAGNVVGGRISQLRKSDFDEILEEMALLKEFPGWKHIHQIVHFHYDSSIPLLLSEACTGNIQELRQNNPSWFQLDNITTTNVASLTPSAHWKKVGWQLGQAVEYMLKRGFAHVDIKPINVLYQQSQQYKDKDHFNIKLADFGLCEKVGPKIYNYAQNNWDSIPMGTLNFQPREWPNRLVEPSSSSHDYSIALNPMTLTLFQFAVVMLCMLYIPEAPKWPGLMHGIYRRKIPADKKRGIPSYKVQNHIEDELDMAVQTQWGKALFVWLPQSSSSSSSNDVAIIRPPDFWIDLMGLIYGWKYDNGPVSDGPVLLAGFMKGVIIL